MDKSIKLPLFLGAVCLIASAALAGINAWTAPIIAQNEADARNRGYLEVLGLESSTGYILSDLIVAEGTLASKGITSYITFTSEADDTLYAIVYNGEVSGWEVGIKFQVGISDGKFTGYNNLPNNETPSIGGAFLGMLDAMISNVACDSTSLNTAINAYIQTNVVGATANFAGVTRNAVTSALIEAGSHYLAVEALS